MSARRKTTLEYATVIGVPAAFAIVIAAQLLEGAPAAALWQPTAALVVFGGTAAAVFVSFPAALVRRTVGAVRDAFIRDTVPVGQTLDTVVRYANLTRRKGAIALEAELDRIPDPFLRLALTLVVDGATAQVVRQILDIENEARREAAEAPADVLEAAAGYAPTLGILGAVLGLIHVMQNLGEPSKLGGGIAVAFVATVYGVGIANLLLLPLATKLRGQARQAALRRDLIVEGAVALQEGLNPRLIEQKLQGFVTMSRSGDRRVA
jgi:chemotaxis protein MotA